MNKIISIDGQVKSIKRNNSGGGLRLDKDGSVSCTKIKKLIGALYSTIDEWDSFNSFTEPIISIRYIRVIPKSLRMGELLKIEHCAVDRTIIGASFDRSSGFPKHIIVYHLPIFALNKAIEKLNKLNAILTKYFNGAIRKKDFSILANTKDSPTDSNIIYKKEMLKFIESEGFSQRVFCQLIQDVYYIEDIYIDSAPKFSATSDMLISFYDIGLSEEELLLKLNLSRRTPHIGKKGEGVSFSLTPSEVEFILDKYPYMISMGVLTDLNNIQSFSGSTTEESMNIPFPADEPTIGVIDCAFDKSAYFSSWVECNEEDSSSDRRHGTTVTSLIVDGPALNPDMEDGCGRFKVKHFSVMGSEDKINQFLLYQRIESIVASNPLIKVWNLSLGTDKEIEKNSISPMASLLDKLQSDRDVIFVVSGTNNFNTNIKQPFIGAPADSINSIVVNAVTKDGKIPQYARKGPVLDFYLCPDLCAIGGDQENPLKACTGKKIASVWGTSYAACWVTRKLAYLIYYMNCTKEEAKAILIDAAYGWSLKQSPKEMEVKGCGILPHHINSILETPNDEVKIVIKGCCEKYRTYSYNVNVPLDNNGKFPYWAKATLCYFPKTSRKQGVDYAQTEIDLHFGRLEGELKVRSINDNHQGDLGPISTFEIEAIENFRKWDCTKHIQEEIKKQSRPRKVLHKTQNGGGKYQPWGFYLLKSRRTSYIEDNPNFALVLTFKSMDDKNRFNEFLQTSQYSGWFTRVLDPVVMHSIYEEGQADIEFD